MSWPVWNASLQRMRLSLIHFDLQYHGVHVGRGWKEITLWNWYRKLWLMLGVEILSRSENIDNSVNLCLGYIMVSDFILFYFIWYPAQREEGRRTYQMKKVLKNIIKTSESKQNILKSVKNCRVFYFRYLFLVSVCCTLFCPSGN